MKPIKPIEPIKCKPCQANDPQVFYVVLVEWSPPNLVWHFSHGLSELSNENENLCMDNNIHAQIFTYCIPFRGQNVLHAYFGAVSKF